MAMYSMSWSSCDFEETGPTSVPCASASPTLILAMRAFIASMNLE